MTISVIIVNFNGAQYTLDCVASLRRHAPPVEIVVVDNKSSDAERETLKQNLGDCVLILNDSNLGFGGANNRGAEHARGELLFFLNNDTLLASDIITPLSAQFRHNVNLGIAGPSLRYQDGSLQVSFGRFPSLVGESQTKAIAKSLDRKKSELPTVEPWMTDWITGAAMMVRRECFEKLRGFDERYFMYFEDVDLCYRARQLGYDVGLVRDCFVIHLGGMSHASAKPMIRKEYRRSQLRFYDKFRSWPERLLLRVYLLAKTLTQFAVGTDRSTSAAIIGLIFQSHGT